MDEFRRKCEQFNTRLRSESGSGYVIQNTWNAEKSDPEKSKLVFFFKDDMLV
jgi:hypothetical protein